MSDRPVYPPYQNPRTPDSIPAGLWGKALKLKMCRFRNILFSEPPRADGTGQIGCGHEAIGLVSELSMAVRALIRSFLGAQIALITWPGLAKGDTGQPLELPEYGDRTVSFEGTFGVDGSVTLEGSDDGRSYHPLTDPQGHAITKTAAATERVTETPHYTRPHVTAGDRSTAIQCRIVARSSSR